jgi:hypothetical protein
VERHTARDDGLTTASFLPASPFAATGWTETAAAAREAIAARAWCAQLRGRVLQLVWKYMCSRLNSTERDEDLERVVVGGDRFSRGAGTDEAHRPGAMWRIGLSSLAH